MNTMIISAEVSTEDIPVLEVLLKKFKAKSVKFQEKDPTKMSKEEFFGMIDKRRKSKDVEISREKLRQLMFE